MERNTLPLEGNFCKSFSVDQQEEYVAFFKKYGFVVIKDVLTPEEIKLTQEEIWTSPSQLGKYICDRFMMKPFSSYSFHLE